MADAIDIQLPFTHERMGDLKAGDKLSLTGRMYALRDAGHIRLLEKLDAEGALPFGLAGQTIFYAGPTPPTATKPFGAIGPTTASRMDFAAPRLYEAGISATIGKGKRSCEVVRACERNGCLYLAAIGGVAALLADCVTESHVVAWEDLGTEALWCLEVRNFPVYVEVDAQGNDLYRMVEGS